MKTIAAAALGLSLLTGSTVFAQDTTSTVKKEKKHKKGKKGETTSSTTSTSSK